MPTNDTQRMIKKIETRLTGIQKSQVSLQEKLKHGGNEFERMTDDAILRMIDILDMIELSRKSGDVSGDMNPNAPLVIKKIEKRLLELIRCWQVQEIRLEDGKIEPGKARVLETRKSSGDEISTGSIIEVCRKGYQRGNKIIRPADVITAD